MAAITEEDVLSALKSCYDPEIPVNIVDLGLIYTINFAPVAGDAPNPEAAGEVKAVEINASQISSGGVGSGEKDAKQDVTVDMTLTAQGCPEHVNISAQVKSRIEQLPGVRTCNVNVVWTPPWTPERLSPDARKQLGIE